MTSSTYEWLDELLSHDAIIRQLRLIFNSGLSGLNNIQVNDSVICSLTSAHAECLVLYLPTSYKNYEKMQGKLLENKVTF